MSIEYHFLSQSNTHPELFETIPIFLHITCIAARSNLDNPGSNVYAASSKYAQIRSAL